MRGYLHIVLHLHPALGFVNACFFLQDINEIIAEDI